jgi:hypothetical protein
MRSSEQTSFVFIFCVWKTTLCQDMLGTNVRKAQPKSGVFAQMAEASGTLSSFVEGDSRRAWKYAPNHTVQQTAAARLLPCHTTPLLG